MDVPVAERILKLGTGLPVRTQSAIAVTAPPYPCDRAGEDPTGRMLVAYEGLSSAIHLGCPKSVGRYSG